jgi:hypothetical protein
MEQFWNYCTNAFSYASTNSEVLFSKANNELSTQYYEFSQLLLAQWIWKIIVIKTKLLSVNFHDVNMPHTSFQTDPSVNAMFDLERCCSMTDISL